MKRTHSNQLLSERLEKQGLGKDFLTPLAVEEQNVATATETTGSLLALMVPGVIISLGLSAGIPVAVASVAGEKKNQTLEPVLFTTINRFHLVLAKLLAVMGSILFNLLATIFMFAASAVVVIVVLYGLYKDDLSNLLTNVSSPSSLPTPAMTTDVYSLDPLARWLFLLAPILIILFGALIELVVSTWARNDEEAYTYMMPLNFLGFIVMLAAFFLDEFIPQLWHYSLPIFGTVLSMRDLLSNQIDPASLTVMFLSSAVYVALMFAFAVWMFQREEVVFRT
jgi:sodium transport system permease protein